MDDGRIGLITAVIGLVTSIIGLATALLSRSKPKAPYRKPPKRKR